MKSSGYNALLVFAFMLLSTAVSFAAGTPAVPERRDVRKGNRDFKKGEYKEAEIDYRKALVKDSLSFAANYNLSNTLYRMNDIGQARKGYEALKDVAASSPHASDYYYNAGNAAASAKDWQAAVDFYKQSLLRNPSDLDAKENYIYAKKKLEESQDSQDKEQDNRDQNQDQNKNQEQDNKDESGKDENRDNPDNGQGKDNQENASGNQPKITPQAAQQMLQAIQAKEKETQDKVKKEKARALKSRQKEKNW